MKHILVFGFLLSSYTMFPQIFGTRQLINNEAGSVSGILTGDIDNDGDLDLIIVASHKIGWHENMDGLGNFGTLNIIDENLGIALGEAIADVDENNKLDIIISSFDQDRVVWYRNLGNGNFSPSQQIAAGLNSARGIAPADLDGDGDLDLVLGVTNGTGFYWVEHFANHTFGPLLSIDSNLSQARNQALGDIDGDGDLDILTNSVGNIFLSWFKNLNGQGNFGGAHIIDAIGLYENYIYLADLDGDSDLDILSNKIDQIIWRENLNGLGTFGPKQIINTTTELTPDFVSPHAVDLDNDGDLDVVYNSVEDFGSIWQENLDGLGDFGAPQFIDPTFVGPVNNVHPADIDGDGDIDLVMNSLLANGDKLLFWYENLTILGVEENELATIALYPNPTTGMVEIKGAVTIEKIEAYDILGRLVLQQEGGSKQIDVSKLASGLLLIKIKTEQGIVVKQLIKE